MSLFPAPTSETMRSHTELRALYYRALGAYWCAVKERQLNLFALFVEGFLLNLKPEEVQHFLQQIEYVSAEQIKEN